MNHSLGVEEIWLATDCSSFCETFLTLDSGGPRVFGL